MRFFDADRLDGTWEATFTRPVGKFEQVEQYYAPADSLPLAICNAFLAYKAQQTTT